MSLLQACVTFGCARLAAKISLLPPFPAGNVCPHKHRARIPRIASAIAQRLSDSFDPQQLNKSGFELCALSADNWICYESAQNAAAKSCEYLSLSPCFIMLKTSKAVSLSRPWSVSNPPLSTCPSALGQCMAMLPVQLSFRSSQPISTPFVSLWKTRPVEWKIQSQIVPWVCPKLGVAGNYPL